MRGPGSMPGPFRCRHLIAATARGPDHSWAASGTWSIGASRLAKHRAIARQIARQVGPGTEIRVAEELFGGGKRAKGDDGIDRSIHADVVGSDGFAAVTPEHKSLIIKLFHEEWDVVGMTGDGVNDAARAGLHDLGRLLYACPGPRSLKPRRGSC